MALKFTVHVVQSFIKGYRKSGVISIKHCRDNNQIELANLEWSNVRFLPVILHVILGYQVSLLVQQPEKKGMGASLSIESPQPFWDHGIATTTTTDI